MHYTRHYYGYKTAKDFLLLYPNKTEFDHKDIKHMFESKAILNYMNELVLKIADLYIEMVQPTLSSNHVENQISVLGQDVSYFFNSELFNNETMNYYLENLLDFNDWEELPIVSKDLKLEDFYESSEE